MQNLRFLVLLIEGVAAISALYYYKKNPSNRKVGFFSYFLLLTFFIEALSLFPTIIYWNKSLHFLKTTFLYGNFWLYNPYSILNFIVYVLYFKWNLVNKKARRFINKILIFYALVCILNLIFSDVFFQSHSSLTYIGGSFFVLGVIFYYYFEILLSSKILIIKRQISFYISIITLLYFLTTTPIFIYYRYYTSKSPEFVELSSLILIIANILLYSFYSGVFLSFSNLKIPSTKN